MFGLDSSHLPALLEPVGLTRGAERPSSHALTISSWLALPHLNYDDRASLLSEPEFKTEMTRSASERY